MKLKIKFLSFVFTLLALSACKKDKSNACECSNPASVCSDLPIPSAPTGYYSQPNFYYDSSYTDYPYVNPNNENEIIYYTHYGGNQLIKYNLATRQKQVLVNIAPTVRLLSAPKWGRNGWILLNANSQIYKIRDDGTGLTQLTFDSLGRNYNPEWNYTADKFVVQHAFNVHRLNEGDSSVNSLLIYDADGHPVDTIFYGIAYPQCWQNPSGLLLITGENDTYSLRVIDPSTHFQTILYDPGQSTDDEALQPFWSPDGQEVYYSTFRCGVSKINYSSSKRTCLKAKCENDEYFDIKVLPLSQKILCVKQHTKAPDWYHQYLSSKLVLMNLDGSNEQEINLP